jgi:hypothetical protein
LVLGEIRKKIAKSFDYKNSDCRLSPITCKKKSKRWRRKVSIFLLKPTQVLSKIDEYEEFLKEYNQEEFDDDDEEEGPPPLQVDDVPFKSFTLKIKARIGTTPHPALT